MPVSVRVRFEVLKRDDFTCRYCGKRSPEVVLEVDHIVPVCDGGTDDPINLTTACWNCNRGKAGVSLAATMTGEDPHDRAILLLEQERQLCEYNEVLAEINGRVDTELKALCAFWMDKRFGRKLNGPDIASLRNALLKYPVELIFRAMQIAIDNCRVSSLAYVHGCLNNWRRDAEERQRA